MEGQEGGTCPQPQGWPCQEGWWQMSLKSPMVSSPSQVIEIWNLQQCVTSPLSHLKPQNLTLYLPAAWPGMILPVTNKVSFPFLIEDIFLGSKT